MKEESIKMKKVLMSVLFVVIALTIMPTIYSNAQETGKVTEIIGDLLGDDEYLEDIDGVMDVDGNIHSYYYYEFDDEAMGQVNRFKYLSNVTGSWVAEEIWFNNVANSSIDEVSLAVDSSGIPYILYFHDIDYQIANQTNLILAKKVDGIWEYEVLEGSVSTGYNVSIAIDSLDQVHVCYNYEKD